MSWVNVTADYVPSSGEKVRVEIEFGFAGTYSVTTIRNLLENAGYAVLNVKEPLLRAPFAAAKITVELLAPPKRMREIGEGMADVISELWYIWSAVPVAYARWTESIVPEPSINQVLTIVAVAVIALAAVYFSRRYL